MAEKLRVMVVDDDATTLEVTSALLEERGYEAVSYTHLTLPTNREV